MLRRAAIARSAGIVLLAAMAACTGGSPGSPSLATAGTGPGTGRAGSPAATGSPAPPSAPVNPASEVPAAPPIALLAGLTGDPVAGDLGTVSWGGTTSDAPWVVGPAGGLAAVGTRLTVTFDPVIHPTSWQARWAPIEGHDAGAPRDGGAGVQDSIVVAVPDTAGSWSLQIEARFGSDRSGAWYWRIQVSQ